MLVKLEVVVIATGGTQGLQELHICLIFQLCGNEEAWFCPALGVQQELLLCKQNGL